MSLHGSNLNKFRLCMHILHQVPWQLQRQQVWAVPALQQLHHCRGGRFNRSSRHSCSPHLSGAGRCYLLHTQVSTDLGLPKFLMQPEMASHCECVYGLCSRNVINIIYVQKQDVESQAAEPTEQSATVLESEAKSVIFLPMFLCIYFVCLLDGRRVICLAGHYDRPSDREEWPYLKSGAGGELIIYRLMRSLNSMQLLKKAVVH